MDSEVSTTLRSALPMAATTAEQVSALYSEHAGFVRVMLQRLGVRTGDLEVFIRTWTRRERRLRPLCGVGVTAWLLAAYRFPAFERIFGPVERVKGIMLP